MIPNLKYIKSVVLYNGTKTQNGELVKCHIFSKRRVHDMSLTVVLPKPGTRRQTVEELMVLR